LKEQPVVYLPPSGELLSYFRRMNYHPEALLLDYFLLEIATSVKNGWCESAKIMINIEKE